MTNDEAVNHSLEQMVYAIDAHERARSRRMLIAVSGFEAYLSSLLAKKGDIKGRRAWQDFVKALPR